MDKHNEEHIYVAIDLKSFYASVECMERNLNPLRTNLVVADNSRTEKTICLAVSPSLKAYGIPGRARLFEVIQKVKNANNYRRRFAKNNTFIAKSFDAIELKNNKNGIPSNAVSVVTDGIEVFMPFEDLVDLEAEKERLQSEKTKLESEVARATKMLSNPGFVNKAPEAKINEEKAKLVKYQEMLDSVNERLKNI